VLAKTRRTVATPAAFDARQFRVALSFPGELVRSSAQSLNT
jgi:hypothetical protein